MKLTWRDGVTTLLVAAIVALYYAVTREVDVPLIGTVLAGMIATAIMAVAMGIVGVEKREMAEEQAGWLTALVVLGVATAGVLVAGFFYQTQTMYLVLVIGTVAMWAVGMLHHLVTATETDGVFA